MTGEHFWDAELFRLQGELFRLSGDDQAETSFLQAINLAQSQQAKLLELRATVSLQQFQQSQGKTNRDGQSLLNIYQWFNEGFDTFDLKQARALLAQIKVPNVEG